VDDDEFRTLRKVTALDRKVADLDGKVAAPFDPELRLRNPETSADLPRK
jgi:hypothetical protein